jgi:phosphoenolpyruvate carboxykinase (GTP)
MNSEQLYRIKQIKNQEVLLKIANAIVMCNPTQVFINTGSETDNRFIRELSLKNGEEANFGHGKPYYPF